MTTMLQTFDSEGPVARCDAKCYNSKSKRCRCICGGMNHGVGLDRAIQNIHDAIDDPANHAYPPPKDGTTLQNYAECYPIYKQPELFPDQPRHDDVD